MTPSCRIPEGITTTYLLMTMTRQFKFTNSMPIKLRVSYSTYKGETSWLSCGILNRINKYGNLILQLHQNSLIPVKEVGQLYLFI